jgi:hypothetical protein
LQNGQIQVCGASMSYPNHWVIYFDGPYTQKGARAGVLLIPPKGDALKYAIQLGFPATNFSTA